MLEIKRMFSEPPVTANLHQLRDFLLDSFRLNGQPDIHTKKDT